MSNMVAIFRKQLKDTLKNKTVLIQFVMFPILALVMENAVKVDGMPEQFFVTLFAAMYSGMAPLTSMVAIIAEEKEKNTLRVLMMSNVKPYEYLAGVGAYVWSACMLGAMVFCIAGDYGLKTGASFLGIMVAGIFVSCLFGAAIGTGSRTQMMATSITVPVMMIFSFLPMLSMFNSTIAKIAKFTYTEQISILLHEISHVSLWETAPQGVLLLEPICVLTANMLVAAALFTAAYKKCSLD